MSSRIFGCDAQTNSSNRLSAKQKRRWVEMKQQVLEVFASETNLRSCPISELFLASQGLRPRHLRVKQRSHRADNALCKRRWADFERFNFVEVEIDAFGQLWPVRSPLLLCLPRSLSSLLSFFQMLPERGETRTRTNNLRSTLDGVPQLLIAIRHPLRSTLLYHVPPPFHHSDSDVKEA
eukprot:scaffold143642_cov32-Tisochrysis_lutea.AAC.1